MSPVSGCSTTMLEIPPRMYIMEYMLNYVAILNLGMFLVKTVRPCLKLVWTMRETLNLVRKYKHTRSFKNIFSVPKPSKF